MIKGVGKGLGGVFFKPPAGNFKPLNLNYARILTIFTRSLGISGLPPQRFTSEAVGFSR
jgi:hypothetical protein